MPSETYIIIDTANLFFRARHAIRGDLHDQIGMSIHVTLNSVRKAWKEFNGTHVIFALEGRSWRKDVYAPYKRNRAEARAAYSIKEVEADKIFWETYEEFKEFITNKTNCTVLYNEVLEADDLIAGFIQIHPNCNHIIISTDGDFAQLIAPNVKQYNGITGVTTTHEGYFDDTGKRVKDTKTKAIKPAPDTAWLLFEKCMRGDTSDNIFSAYPGVHTKGTKKKVGLLDAYNDRNAKGWYWNNLMLQRWVDHQKIEHRVLEDYTRNVMLCDLSAQPENIRKIIKETIDNNTTVDKNVGQVGIRLLKFCTKYDLVKVCDQIQSYTEPFNARYTQ